jgi:hypothetical protein
MSTSNKRANEIDDLAGSSSARPTKRQELEPLKTPGTPLHGQEQTQLQTDDAQSEADDKQMQSDQVQLMQGVQDHGQMTTPLIAGGATRWFRRCAGCFRERETCGLAGGPIPASQKKASNIAELGSAAVAVFESKPSLLPHSHQPQLTYRQAWQTCGNWLGI